MASARAGIVHQPHGKATIEYLPLEEVRVKAWVVDVSCRILLRQTFFNSSAEPTGRAKYVFPLPANAAVCAFELELDDGSVIVGEIKEKDEAAQLFTHAAEKGKTAALVERVTDDIFTISVGSIPAATRVTTRLTFVMDLLNEALTNHIRLQLPMYVAERYRTPPAAILDASAAGSRTRVHISVDIQTSEEIYDVRSLTHPIALRHYKGRSGRTSKRRMSAVWHSPEFLTSDFVITIYAEGLDKPRCFAEVLHVEESKDGGQESTVAMQLTLVPKFQTAKIPSQEYIFVIDRSGSMQNDKIETAKQTLIMLLRLLPSTQTAFNIISFGDKVDGLWKHSRPLNKASLDEATNHVASMGADYGGTEIPKSLEFAFASIDSRALERQAVVFLLTDGNIHVEDSVLSNLMRNSLHKVSVRVRLFVLGIGRDVSQDVCSQLARYGNGEALFAVSAEEILGKCARLINAGRSKNIESIDIDWGCDISNPTTITRTLRLPAGLPALGPPPFVQQAPHHLTKIFAGVRFTVFTITSFRTVPTSVRLITKLDGDSDPQELTMRVTKVQPFHDAAEQVTIPIVHTLAARRLIMDLDDGVGLLPLPAAGDALLVSEDDLRKAGIVRLGLTYQLVSKHTSFVAVHKGGERGHLRGGMEGARSSLAQTNPDVQVDRSADDLTYLDLLINGVSSLFTTVFASFSNPTAPARPINTPAHSHSRPRAKFPGAFSPSDSGESQSRGRRLRHISNSQRRRSYASDYSADTFSSLSSLEGSSTSSWTSSRSPSPPSRLTDPIERAPSPEFLRDTTHGITDAGLNPGGSQSTRSKRQPIPQDVYQLFRQLTVDGSFTDTAPLSQLVGDAVLGKADELGIDKKVWGTVVFVAYIKTRLESEPDLLDLMWEKARVFVEASERSQKEGGKRFEEMVRAAEAMLSP